MLIPNYLLHTEDERRLDYNRQNKHLQKYIGKIEK